MESEVEIVRSPIKIRKPILRSFCSCWSPNFNVAYVDGAPHYIVVNGTQEDVHQFIESVVQSLSFFVSDSNKEFSGVIGEVVKCGLPIKVGLTRVSITEELIASMSSVPHSSISIGITENTVVVPQDLRMLLSIAKDWKVSSSLRIQYAPHLLRKLDLFDLIDRVKNFISHVEIIYPTYSDDLYQSQLHHSWSEGVVDKFRDAYCPDVTSRSRVS